jgi:hypothetical protein
VGEDVDRVTSEVEVTPIVMESALKLSKGRVCSYAKADIRTIKPNFLSPATNGSEVETLSGLWRLLPRGLSGPAYRSFRRLWGFSP